MLNQKCLEVGLPVPLPAENQQSYVRRILIEGLVIDTRMARFIGIHNLHSIVAALRKSLPITVEHKKVICPLSKKLEPFAVDVVYMTFEQRAEWKKERTA